jgi:hypothetical protein
MSFSPCDLGTAWLSQRAAKEGGRFILAKCINYNPKKWHIIRFEPRPEHSYYSMTICDVYVPGESFINLSSHRSRTRILSPSST